MRLRIFTFLVMFLATMSGAVWGEMKASASMNPYPVPGDKEWYEKEEKGTITIYMNEKGLLSTSEEGKFEETLTLSKDALEGLEWSFDKEGGEKNPNAVTYWGEYEYKYINTTIHWVEGRRDYWDDSKIELTYNESASETVSEKFSYQVKVDNGKIFDYKEGYVTINVVCVTSKTSIEGATITLTDNSKVYDGVEVKPSDISCTITIAGEAITPSAENGLTVKFENDAKPIDQGAYTVYVEAEENSEYMGKSATETYTIEKRPLNIIAIERQKLMCMVGDNVTEWEAASYLTFKTGEGEGLVKVGDINDGAIITGKIKLASGESTETAGEKKLDFSDVKVVADANSHFNESNYTITTAESLASSIVLTVVNKEVSDNGQITIIPDGDETQKITLTNKETKSVPYIGKEYTIEGANAEGTTVTITKGDQSVSEIRNAGTYQITVTVEDEKTITTTMVTLIVEQAELTVTVLPQETIVTDLNKVTLAEDKTSVSVGGNGTVEVAGLQGDDQQTKNIFADNQTLSLATAPEGGWIVGENTEAITAENLTLSETLAENYTVTVVNGNLTINYQIDETNTDEVEVAFNIEGYTKTYDGQPIEVASVSVNGVTLEEGSYKIIFMQGGDVINYNPKDAGIYTAVVIFTKESNYSIAEGVNVTAECKIEKRPLTLTFVFEPIFEKGEPLDYTIAREGLVDGESIDGAIEATFRIADEANEDGHYNVYIEKLFIYKTDNFDPDNYEIGYASGNMTINLEHGEGDTYIPTGGEDNFDTHPAGEIEDIVDPSGESSSGSGIHYNKYKLYLANVNYKISEEEKAAYAAEELTLYSRHEKFSTWAGGSFTVGYKHGEKENDGEYRIFISKNRKDWTELKIDTVSDLYQIRNVQTDIYVKIYGLDGFPVANEEISTTDARAYAQANKIVVITPEPTDVQIISMAGAVVATDQVTGQREFANLMEGIYIVRMGDTVVKLQVRN